MSVWSYDSKLENLDFSTVSGNSCLFCASYMQTWPKYSVQLGPYTISPKGCWRPSLFLDTTEEISYSYCQTCGWWNICKSVLTDDLECQIYGAAGALKTLDISDIKTPIYDVKSYLTAIYKNRCSIHPKLFEETVASVFSCFGYSVIVTGYTNDGGVDVVLERGGETIGVQVKRYKNKIKAEQIRAFTGALVLSRITKGIFITTSSFQTGATVAARSAKACGLSIKLMDAERFYDALRISQRKSHTFDPMRLNSEKLPKLDLLFKYQINGE